MVMAFLAVSKAEKNRLFRIRKTIFELYVE